MVALASHMDFESAQTMIEQKTAHGIDDALDFFLNMVSMYEESV